MQPFPPPPPVGDVPPPALADGAAVAHAWLVRLVAGAPLQHAAGLPVAALAQDGPALAAAVLRAVGSDAALGDLPGAAARAGRLAGAATPADAAAAAAALREACGAALLAGADPARAAALAARLAHVGDVLAQAVLRAPAGTLEARVDEHVAAGRPFAVVAVEVADAERLLAAEREAAVAAALDAARAAAAPGEAVTGEEAGRLWILCPGDGRAVAARVTQAVAGAGAPDGAPLRAGAGVATWPQDGADAGALLARADERLFAALAAGLG